MYRKLSYLNLFFVLLTTLTVRAQDIIVLNNGDLIKSNVEEIGIATIRYKRYEQTNGPAYTINRADVFAIHYNDGTKDFFGRTEQTTADVNRRIEEIFRDTTQAKEMEDSFMKKKTVVHLGFGLQKIYSPTNEIGITKYKAKPLFLQIEAAFGLNTNIVAGISYGFGKYSAEQTFQDQYNLSKTTITIDEDIKAFSIWGRYYIKTRYERWRPYATLGLSLNSSTVEETITTITDNATIVFDRGGRIKDVFPVTKIGVELNVSFIDFYTEIGYALTLVNMGLSYCF